MFLLTQPPLAGMERRAIAETPLTFEQDDQCLTMKVSTKSYIVTGYSFPVPQTHLRTHTDYTFLGNAHNLHLQPFC